ncbi:MAG: four helix bundle protein [Lentimicrobium sp.]|nr:four helix bundle protein [Lentimicrobium sp.]
MKVYDLGERTAVFGENIIKLCNSLPRTVVTTPLIYQLVKCGTSVGANYSEADNAESDRDFRHKIGICKKEAKESRFFLRMMQTATPEMIEKLQELYQEANELNLIFNSIYNKIQVSK